jgi:prevent-host-death family protein
MNWALQDAKNRFSEVVKRARSEGPQTVTLRGARAAVVLSAEDYDRLAGGAGSLVDALLAGPEWDEEFAASVAVRDPEPLRDAEL